MTAGASGDRDTRERLALLIDGVLDAAYRTALYLCGDEAQAAEVIAAAASRAAEDPEALTQGSHFRCWFLAIVMELASALAPGGPEPAFGAPAQEDAPGEWLPATREGAGRSMGIEEALLSLPLAQREVAVLYFGAEASSAEIADVLHAPQVLVRERLQEARGALRRHAAFGARVTAA